MPPISDTLLNAPLSRRTLSLTAFAVTLSACGGGGNSPTSTLPAITTQPESVSISAGESATFRVVARSDTALSYQWLRNGMPIEKATAAEFSLPLVIATDSGSTFSVRVSNAAGTVQSNTATLSVQFNEGIAPASGALKMIGSDRTVTGFSRSGDIFVWDRGPATEYRPTQLIRLGRDGTSRALLGSKQTLELASPWRISVLEHSNGNIYVSESYVTSYSINVYTGYGGRIHRITPDGSHSVIYDSKTATVPIEPITPVAIVEGPDAELRALHLNTVTLFNIPETGAPTAITSLTNEPVENLPMVFASTPYLNVAATQAGDVFVESTKKDLIKTQYAPFNDSSVAGIGVIGNHLYALVDDASGYKSLVRRNSDGSTQRIAGGVAAPESGTPQPGPLSGSLGGSTIRLVGTTPEGTIVLGQRSFSGLSPDDIRYDQYFAVTPPATA